MNRLLYLPSPGLLADALPLDVLLAYSPDQEFGVLSTSDVNTMANFSTSVLLVHPSRAEHSRLKEQLSLSSRSDNVLLDSAFPEHDIPQPNNNGPPINMVDLASLRDTADDFDGDAFEEKLTYMRMWDPLLPGPAVDIPRELMKKAWPENVDAKYVYRNMFDKFQQLRMDVCGLGLEPWPKSGSEEL